MAGSNLSAAGRVEMKPKKFRFKIKGHEFRARMESSCLTVEYKIPGRSSWVQAAHYPYNRSYPSGSRYITEGTTSPICPVHSYTMRRKLEIRFPHLFRKGK